MLDFLLIVTSLTLIAIILNVFIRVLIIKPGQVSKIQLFLEDGKMAEALLYINMRLKRQPYSTTLRYWQAELLWRLGRHQESASILESIKMSRLRVSPEYYAQALFRLGTWYYEQKNYDQSSFYFNLLLKTPTDNPDYLYGAALLALKEENPAQAVDLLTRALRADSSSPAILRLLADTYMVLKNYDEAYAVCTRLSQLTPDDPAVWLMLADICVHSKNTAKAVKYFNKVETFPYPKERFKASIGLAAIYQEIGEHYQSIRCLSKAIAYAQPEFCPTSQLLELHYELAELYVVVDDISQALIQWEIILKINRSFKDVAFKYEEFRQIRLMDFIKDILTLNGNRLIEAIFTFVKSLGLTVQNYSQNPDNSVDIFTAVEGSASSGKYTQKSMFTFWCSSDPLPLSLVEDIKHRQANNQVHRVYLISAGPILSEARQILSRRAVNFYDSETLNDIFGQLKNPSPMEDFLEP